MRKTFAPYYFYNYDVDRNIYHTLYDASRKYRKEGVSVHHMEPQRVQAEIKAYAYDRWCNYYTCKACFIVIKQDTENCACKRCCQSESRKIRGRRIDEHAEDITDCSANQTPYRSVCYTGYSYRKESETYPQKLSLDRQESCKDNVKRYKKRDAYNNSKIIIWFWAHKKIPFSEMYSLKQMLRDCRHHKIGTQKWCGYTAP